MSDDLTINSAAIVRGGRALFSCLQPLTGERAVGQVRMKAKSGKQFRLPRYTYMMPVVDGAQHWSWLFKLDKGPEPDGSWLIGDQDVDVDVYSAVGGARFNVHLGTTFVFDYLIPDLDLDPAPYAIAEFVGGMQPQDEFGSFGDAAVYETFDGPAIPLDLRRSLLTRFPALLVAFMDMTPADGVTTAQTRHGSVNAGDGTKFYKINYAISIIVSRTDNDLSRRFQGMVLTDKVLAELVDQHASNDGEPLSNPGGVQIRQVLRESGPQDLYKKFFIYTVLVSVMTTVTRTERRTFSPWLRARFSVDSPQDPELANQGTLRLVNQVIVDMSAETPDLTLDGSFARASTATYWPGTILSEYASGVRRVVDGELFLEPAVSNVLTTASTDFELWDELVGASVAPPAASNPAGYSNTANVVSFGASIASGIELAAVPVTVGQKHVFYVFLKATAVLTDAVVLMADDGSFEYTSDAIDVTTGWVRRTFEFTPTATPVTLRVMNARATAHDVAVWGAMFGTSSRWGAEFTASSKAKDVLTFLPYGLDTDPEDSDRTPKRLLLGRWSISLRTLAHVPVELTGAGLASAPVVASLNDGATDLFLLTLQGIPTAGATLTIDTRDGPPLALTEVWWTPGATLRFEIDAAGSIRLSGTDTHDGVYSFSRYDVSATPTVDRLVLGSDASGAKGAVPGFYSVEINE